MKIRVDVMLKSGVLDPQGKAIGHALSNMGFKGVTDVRAGKTIEIEMEGNDKARAIKDVEKMAEKLLANKVIEDFKVSAA